MIRDFLICSGGLLADLGPLRLWVTSRISLCGGMGVRFKKKALQEFEIRYIVF